MAVLLTIVDTARASGTIRVVSLAPGTSILKAAHAAGIDVTATCGGRGRCTSCRVRFMAGVAPPPTIMDDVQLGEDLVREGYRLACQCVPTDAVTVQVAPPQEERDLSDPGRRRLRGARRPHHRVGRRTSSS